MSRLRHHAGRCLLAGILLLVAACKPKPKQAPAAAVPVVQVAPVIQRDEAIRQEWISTLDGFVNAQIRAQVTGYLRRQGYVEGTPVKKGDLLFEIDPRPFEAALAQVKANYDQAELNLKRASVLSEENAASKQDRDNALHAFEAAKAALQAAQLNLDFTRILSPIDGIAGLANAQIGDLLGPSSGVLTTVSTVDPIKAYFAISEREYLELRDPATGQPRFPEGLELVLPNGTTDPHRGRVYSLDRQVDPNTGTLRVVAVFPNPDLLLRPGQYGRVQGIVRIQRQALLVPQRAVTELQGGFQLVTVDAENRAHVRPVKLGPRVGSQWIVEEGLHPGDRVVVEGSQKARDGVVVRPEAYSAEGSKAPVAAGRVVE